VCVFFRAEISWRKKKSVMDPNINPGHVTVTEELFVEWGRGGGYIWPGTKKMKRL
jgi:hypothetical protein